MNLPLILILVVKLPLPPAYLRHLLFLSPPVGIGCPWKISYTMSHYPVSACTVAFALSILFLLQLDLFQLALTGENRANSSAEACVLCTHGVVQSSADLLYCIAIHKLHTFKVYALQGASLTRKSQYRNKA